MYAHTRDLEGGHHLQFGRDKDSHVSLTSRDHGEGQLIAVERPAWSKGRERMAIRIAEVKSSSLSEDKKEVIIGGYGKYIGDVELRFARECLDDLMGALVRAKSALGPSANSGLVSNDAGIPAPERNGSASANPDQINFRIPKNFTVTADTSGRRLVPLILNHRMENQEGFALSPDAAKQVAGGLTKSADAVFALSPPPD
jgi:hypothetical protein